jgi:hypothetical protein
LSLRVREHSGALTKEQNKMHKYNDECGCGPEEKAHAVPGPRHGCTAAAAAAAAAATAVDRQRQIHIRAVHHLSTECDRMTAWSAAIPSTTGTLEWRLRHKLTAASPSGHTIERHSWLAVVEGTYEVIVGCFEEVLAAPGTRKLLPIVEIQLLHS